jgi:chorismate mutase
VRASRRYHQSTWAGKRSADLRWITYQRVSGRAIITTFGLPRPRGERLTPAGGVWTRKTIRLGSNHKAWDVRSHAFFVPNEEQEVSVALRGVRGATTVERDGAEEILAATRELLGALAEANGIAGADVASIIFTTTPDLTAAFPARAARELGWTDVALLGAQEAGVREGPDRCIRVLMHWNTNHRQDEVVHVYLKEAKQLRPDRTERRRE